MTTTPQAALLSDELHALIRSFGYTTNSQTHDLVTAIIAKMQATQEPVQAGELPPLPFAVFDEFGKGCEDRVQDHYYNAHRAALSARKPLTDEQIVASLKACEKEDHTKEGWIWRTRIKWARAIERAHGIGLEVKS
jgi:hypothetical protein